jgi:hypothetical protein
MSPPSSGSKNKPSKKNFTPKRRLDFNGVHCIMSQKILRRNLDESTFLLVFVQKSYDSYEICMFMVCYHAEYDMHGFSDLLIKVIKGKRITVVSS